MCILLIFHTGKGGYNPWTHIPVQNELPGVTGALGRVPAETALLARDFTSSQPWLTGVWSKDQPGKSILLGLSVHTTAIKESAVALTSRGRGGAVCLQLVLPNLLWSGAKGRGKRRLLLQSWPNTNSEELIKRRDHEANRQGEERGWAKAELQVRKKRLAGGAEKRVDRHKEKEGTQSVGEAQPGEPWRQGKGVIRGKQWKSTGSLLSSVEGGCKRAHNWKRGAKGAGRFQQSWCWQGGQILQLPLRIQEGRRDGC